MRSGYYWSLETRISSESVNLNSTYYLNYSEEASNVKTYNLANTYDRMYLLKNQSIYKRLSEDLPKDAHSEDLSKDAQGLHNLAFAHGREQMLKVISANRNQLKYFIRHSVESPFQLHNRQL